MSIPHRFTTIALACVLVGACANSDRSVGYDGAAIVQRERLKFLILVAGGTGRGPWLKRYNEKIRNYSNVEQISVSYLNDKVKRAFDDALRSEIIANNTGKRAICDCEGHYVYEIHGKGFEVSSFKVYFENIYSESH
jgi:hypothetical protein